jgi:alpha-beta hydrolase superfamily lysophospholipase
MKTLHYASHFIEPVANVRLHLQEIYAADPTSAKNLSDRGAVLFLHGSIENGRIFYSEKGRGLAAFLAQQGYHCYVADLRGRGKSEPVVGRGADHGQWESVVEDIPAIHQFVCQRHGQGVHWIAHSWGGTLGSATLVRFPELRSTVRSLTMFGVKRQITVRSAEYYFKIAFIWQAVAKLSHWLWGYFPAKRLGFGADNEPWGSVWQVSHWIKNSRWQDPIDGFDYSAALQAQQEQLAAQPDSNYHWPRSWFIAGASDKVLAHVKDVQLLMDELQGADMRLTLLAKANGYRHDYGHIDMLVHRDANGDHFQALPDWLDDVPKKTQ